MFEWLDWFTNESNLKTFILLFLCVAFVIIIVYVFTDKRRAKRLESYRYIPLDDDDAVVGGKEPKNEHRQD